MVEMDEHDFSDMVEQTPVNTYIVEYREPTVDGTPGRLVGACLTDQQADGLSMIYSFFDDGVPGGGGAGPRHLYHPRPYRPRRPGRASLCLSRLLGRGSEAHGLQGPLPPARELGPGGWRRMDEAEVDSPSDEPRGAADAAAARASVLLIDA